MFSSINTVFSSRLAFQKFLNQNWSHVFNILFSVTSFVPNTQKFEILEHNFRRFDSKATRFSSHISPQVRVSVGLLLFMLKTFVVLLSFFRHSHLCLSRSLFHVCALYQFCTRFRIKYVIKTSSSSKPQNEEYRYLCQKWFVY